MKKIVFGFIACGVAVVATSALAEPRITTAPPDQTLVQRIQHFGWPDRPSGPGGPPYSGVNSCDAVQEVCGSRWVPGGLNYSRCMLQLGC